MTRIAGYFAMGVEIILVDGERHLHHLPRCLLRLLVVFVERILNVAKIALNSQRSRDELHGREYLLGWNALEHLYVLELFFGLLRDSGPSLARRNGGKQP
jgi:hypothetical protein